MPTIANVTFYGTDQVGNAIQRDRADHDRLRQLWGSVGPWLSHTSRRAAVALALLAAAGCTVHQHRGAAADRAVRLWRCRSTITAIPDSITQDGGSQSSVKVTAIGPNGSRSPALPLRLDMLVNGVPQDFGTLSARIDRDQRRRHGDAVYTAPPRRRRPAASAPARGLPGNCVDDRRDADRHQLRRPPIREPVDIRLVPTGVILPPAGTPTAAFTVSPTPVDVERAGRSSTRRRAAARGTRRAAHDHRATPGRSATARPAPADRQPHYTLDRRDTYNVTLTVTNDRGVTASTTQVGDGRRVTGADRRLRVLAGGAERRRHGVLQRRRRRGRPPATRSCSSAGTSATAHGVAASRRRTSYTVAGDLQRRR